MTLTNLLMTTETTNDAAATVKVVFRLEGRYLQGNGAGGLNVLPKPPGDAPYLIVDRGLKSNPYYNTASAYHDGSQIMRGMVDISLHHLGKNESYPNSKRMWQLKDTVMQFEEQIDDVEHDQIYVNFKLVSEQDPTPLVSSFDLHALLRFEEWVYRPVITP